MEGLVYKQTRAHSPECSAVKMVERGDWDTPWWWPGKYRAARNQGEPVPVRLLDTLARRTRYRTSGRTWLVLQCNCTRCDAEMLVREEVLFDAVPTGG